MVKKRGKTGVIFSSVVRGLCISQVTPEREPDRERERQRETKPGV